MDIHTIKKEILTYILLNTPKEFEHIPFDNIFGGKYNLDELAELIQKEIEYVEKDNTKYYIGIWYNPHTLFIAKIK